MDELKIERTCAPGFACIFHIGEQEYLGSLIIQTAYADYYGTECIIFKSKNGQFTFDDALAECMPRNIDFSQDALRECVTDFINGRIGVSSAKSC